MSIIILPNGTTLHMDMELSLLNQLRSDIARIDDGWRPGERDLADAPIIERWSLGMRMQPCLTGVVHNHPTHVF